MNHGRQRLWGCFLLITWFLIGWAIQSIPDPRLLGGLLWLSILAIGILYLTFNNRQDSK